MFVSHPIDGATYVARHRQRGGKILMRGVEDELEVAVHRDGQLDAGLLLLHVQRAVADVLAAKLDTTPSHKLMECARDTLTQRRDGHSLAVSLLSRLAHA